MTVAPHTIAAAYGARRTTKRVGRGNGSQKGTMSGRGGKGQTARSGGGSGLARKAFKKTLQKVPKLRGFKSSIPKKNVVTLSTLERIAKANKIVTPLFLKEQGVVNDIDHGVKILATGTVTKAITVEGCLASKKAVEAIEKAGGKVVF